jgi:hypothetical protein
MTVVCAIQVARSFFHDLGLTDVWVSVHFTVCGVSHIVCDAPGARARAHVMEKQTNGEKLSGI